MFHLVGDIVGLLNALGGERAVVVGHEWGAPVAWNTALFRPDRVWGVAGLSVPFGPRGGQPPLFVMRSAVGESFYQMYFEKPGVAEADLARDVRTTMQTVLYGASGQNPSVPDMMVKPGHGFLERVMNREVPSRRSGMRASSKQAKAMKGSAARGWGNRS